MPWFELETTSLRSAEPDDAEALFSYLNHASVFEDRQFGDRTAFPLSRAEISKQLAETHDTGRILIIESDGAVMGHASLDWWWDANQPWGGLAIDPRHRGQGHGRRAALMILDYYFEQTPAHVVTCDVGEWNLEGLAFAAGLGFTKAGEFRRSARRGGAWQDVVTFDMLRREWEESRADR